MSLSVISGLADEYAAAALETAVRWTVPFALVWCATRIRTLSAAARHQLWCMLLVGLVVLPLAQGRLPVVRVERPAVLPGAAPADLAPDLSTEPGRASAASAAGAAAGEGAEAPAATAVATDPGRRGSAQARVLQSGSGSFARLWTWVWLGIAGMLLTARALAQLLVWRLARDARAAPEAQHRLLWECMGRLGVRRRVRLLVSDEETVPMTWGLVRPVVLLPASSASWSPDRLRRVLSHELAHVARGDCATDALTRGVCALFWFHPGAWWAARASRREAEIACDDRVVQAEGGAIAYAADLLGVARALRPWPVAPAALPMAQAGGLEQRIRRLLEPDLPRGLSRRRRVLLAAGVASVVIGAAVLDWAEAALGPAGARAEWLRPASLPDGRAAWTMECGPREETVCRDGTRKALALLERTGLTGVVVAQRVATGEIVLYAAVRPAGSGRAGAVPLAPPGSVAKLALAALWWESGMGDQAIPCPAQVTLPSGLVVRNAGRSDLGPVPVGGMLAASCNTAAAAMARALTTRLGTDELARALGEFGFAGPSGPPGTTDESFWAVGPQRPADWAPPPQPYLRATRPALEDVLVLAGLGVEGSATTPLHVSRLLQAVGNEGVLLIPRPLGAGAGPQHASRILEPATAANLRAAMLHAVREGTAARTVPQLEWSSWSLGGKTGTVPGEGAADGWFAGLAHDPDGRAAYTVVVLVEGGGTGGGAAAGIAAELTRMFARAHGDEL